MATTTTNVKQVKMNIMTQQQYTQATKNPNELYMVTDAELYSSFTGADGTNAGTSGLVLQNKISFSRKRSNTVSATAYPAVSGKNFPGNPEASSA